MAVALENQNRRLKNARDLTDFLNQRDRGYCIIQTDKWSRQVGDQEVIIDDIVLH
jgi:hypothetical protein